MTDSPAVRAPLDPNEQPILDRLLGLRDKLTLLKQDRSTYVKSRDVIALYDQVIEQVEALNDIRTHKRTEQNRVDTVLDDCFQLISLFFLTIGRNNEAPAVYSAVSTTKRLLDHLKEAGFYTAKDLDGITHALQEMRASVGRGEQDYNPHLLTLLEARIDVCEEVLRDLKTYLSHLSPELSTTHEKLVSILRCLSASSTRSKFPLEEVEDFEKQLNKIEEELRGSNLVLSPSSASPEERYANTLRSMSVDLSHTAAPEGQRVVLDLLTRCLLWVQIVKAKQGKIDDRFQDVYDKLLGIRNHLEKLSLTQAWSLRETDLYSYQRQLDRVDEARVDGNFLDAECRPADLHAQRTLLYLLRKSYSLIYLLIMSSEPVSEALLPMYNQLRTLKRCLVQIKKSGGVSDPRELYPYSMKLNSIDNMRKDGKFMVGNDIPEGQGIINGLMSECFELAYEMRVEAEENSGSDDEGSTGQEDGVDGVDGVDGISVH